VGLITAEEPGRQLIIPQRVGYTSRAHCPVWCSN